MRTFLDGSEYADVLNGLIAANESRKREAEGRRCQWSNEEIVAYSAQRSLETMTSSNDLVAVLYGAVMLLSRTMPRAEVRRVLDAVAASGKHPHPYGEPGLLTLLAEEAVSETAS